MSEIDVVFFDVGGVLLTNGWDSQRREEACAAFGLDWAEFEDRHQFVADRFETGHIDLDTYLDRTVFYRDRAFGIDDFAEVMRASSKELPEGMDLVRKLRSHDVVLATLNNESAALNDYRIRQFGLDKLFTAFFSSCYLGAKKPDDSIFRTALSVMAVAPERAVFVDDRDLNLECARRMGIHTVHHVDAETTESQLAEIGLRV